MIVQSFSPTAEFLILIGTKTNEANSGTESQPVTFEAKLS